MASNGVRRTLPDWNQKLERSHLMESAGLSRTGLFWSQKLEGESREWHLVESTGLYRTVPFCWSQKRS